VVGADDSGTPQRVYRVVGGYPITPSRSTVRSHAGSAGPLPVQQFQASESGCERLLLSPDAVPRVVSYRIHPVRSEVDFSRPAAVYSTEWHAPVNQYEAAAGTWPSSNGGGWRTASGNDRYYESRSNDF